MVKLGNAGGILGGIVAGFLFVAAVAIASRTPIAAGTSLPTALSTQPTGISVSGEGRLTLVPDVAVVQLGVEAQAKTVEEARQQAADAMDRVAAALRASGVADKDTKTVQFSLTPNQRSGPNGSPLVDGYRVSNMVTAKVRTVTDTGKILDRAAVAGGNLARVNRVDLTVDDMSRFQGQLRDLAMADAKNKAEQLARVSGRQLGSPIYIQDGAAAPVPRTLDFRAAPSASQSDTSISPGEMEVTHQVQVVYEIR